MAIKFSWLTANKSKNPTINTQQMDCASGTKAASGNTSQVPEQGLRDRGHETY